jgi:hypothetical protein
VLNQLVLMRAEVSGCLRMLAVCRHFSCSRNHSTPCSRRVSLGIMSIYFLDVPSSQVAKADRDWAWWSCLWTAFWRALSDEFMSSQMLVDS